MTHLSDGPERRDFQYLEELISDPRGQARMAWESQAGAAHRRFLYYMRNPNLQLMLGSSGRVIDWGQVIREGKLVLVNLALGTKGRRVLLPEDQRTLGLQIVTSIIDECFSHQRIDGQTPPPCYLYIDECQHFISQDLEQILAERRQFGLRLMLACRSPRELVRDGDDKLLRLVAGCTQAKFVFGGLSWAELEPLAYDLYGHGIDLMETKDQIETEYQTQDREEETLTTDSIGGSEARGWARGSSESTFSGMGSGEVHLPDGMVEPFDETLRTTSRSNQESRGQSDTSAESWSEASGWSQSQQTRWVTVPSEIKKQIVSRTYWQINEQMHKAVSRLVNQPRQHAVFAAGKDVPVEFKVPTLEEPSINLSTAEGIDLEVMRSLPYYSPPRLIKEEIQDRQNRFLERPRSRPTPLKAIHRGKK